jgi:hypothetical protein
MLTIEGTQDLALSGRSTKTEAKDLPFSYRALRTVLIRLRQDGVSTRWCLRLSLSAFVPKALMCSFLMKQRGQGH